MAMGVVITAAAVTSEVYVRRGSGGGGSGGGGRGGGASGGHLCREVTGDEGGVQNVVFKVGLTL